MQYPDYTSGNVVLSEGEWFPFRIHNLVQLQDEVWYFVLQDINGLKHFMPAGYYEKYGFNAGDEVSCKIDRINCTGRMFLEPKNPFYTEGEIYSFELIAYANQGSNKLLIVREIMGNSIEVPLYDIENVNLEGQKKVRCRVRGMRKGKPILELFNDYA